MVNPDFLPSPGDENPFTSSDGDSRSKPFSPGTSSSGDYNVHGYIEISLPSGNPNLRKHYEATSPNFESEHINEAIFASEMSGPGIENPFQTEAEKSNST